MGGKGEERFRRFGVIKRREGERRRKEDVQVNRSGVGK